MRMPKMQVYLPEDLYARVKRRGAAINVSSILQRALAEAIAEAERQEALDSAIRAYEGKHGEISQRAMDAQEARDRAAARRPSRRRPRKKAA
jgi:hypothetical protein